MTEKNFADILDTPMDDVEKPKPLPTGSYVWQITETVLDQTKPKDGKEPTPYVSLKCAAVSALEDVDADELEAAGGLRLADGSPKTTKQDFYITAAALYRLKEFASDVIGMDVVGKSTGEVIQELVNQQFVGTIVHVPAKNDPTTVYANLGACVKFEG